MALAEEVSGFIVAVCGDIMAMLGLPRAPSANRIRIGESGEVEGLFQRILKTKDPATGRLFNSNHGIKIILRFSIGFKYSVPG